MVEFKFFDNAGAFRRGREFKQKQQDRNALMQAGQMAAGGDFTGARNSALGAGQLNAAKAFQGFQDAQVQRQQAAQQRDAAKDKEQLDMMLQTINAAQTPEQFELAKQQLLANGVADQDDLQQIGGFENKEFFVRKFMPISQQLDLMLKQQKGMEPTAAMKNAEFMSKLPPNDPRLKFMMKPANQVNITNVGEKEEAKKMGGFRVKQFEKGDTEKQTAISNLIEYQVLEQASQDPDLHQGVLGGASLGIKRVMKEVFGADVGGTTSGEIIQKANTRLIQEAIKVQGRGFSDADLKFSQKAQPGILDSKEAFTVSIGMAKRAEQFKILKQNFREDYFNQNGTLKGVNKRLRKLEDKYIRETKQDLRKLRGMAAKIRQTLPTAGAGKVIDQFKRKFKGLE